MKYIHPILVIAALFSVCTAFAQKKEKPVYVFGIAASFSDTIVYYTEIQLLDSVSLNKEGFLPAREQYTYQLKSFLENKQDKPNYTCMIYFSKNKNKLAKEAAKVKEKYTKSNLTLQAIKPDTFSFEKAE